MAHLRLPPRDEIGPDTPRRLRIAKANVSARLNECLHDHAR
jgi:hypothetical protein